MSDSQKPEWKEIKQQIKTKFSKLSETDINGLQGHLDQLQMKVQTAYGYSSEKAKEECKRFNESIKKK